MLKLIILLGILGLFLTGCDTTQQVVTINKMMVAMPPQQYFNCQLTGLPKQFKTNADVAKLLVQIWHDNNVCHINMVAIQNYLNEAQSKIK